MIAIGFTNGKIVFQNVKADETLFTLKASKRPTVMSFSKVDYPLLATGDELGNITLWDLKEKKLYSQLLGAHHGTITSLTFMPNEQILISASGEQNSIKQWKYEEFEESKLALLR